MPFQSWEGLLNTSPQMNGAGTVLNTATTATISPQFGGSDFPIQAAGQPYGWYPGMILRINARGYLTTTATTANATFLLASRVTNNSTPTYVTLATTQAVATGATAYTGIPWKLEAMIRCLAIGSTGSTLSTEGEMYISANPATAQTVNTASAGVNLYMPSASGETAAAVDTTQLQGLAMRATLSAANATIQLTQWFIEALD